MTEKELQLQEENTRLRVEIESLQEVLRTTRLEINTLIEQVQRFQQQLLTKDR